MKKRRGELRLLISNRNVFGSRPNTLRLFFVLCVLFCAFRRFDRFLQGFEM